MAEIIPIGEVAIAVTRKDVKHVHLSVHPPMGHVTLVAPIETRPDVARAYAISKLGWIRDQQATLRRQARETPRQFVERGEPLPLGAAISSNRRRKGCEALRQS